MSDFLKPQDAAEKIRVELDLPKKPSVSTISRYRRNPPAGMEKFPQTVIVFGKAMYRVSEVESWIRNTKRSLGVSNA